MQQVLGERGDPLKESLFACLNSGKLSSNDTSMYRKLSLEPHSNSEFSQFREFFFNRSQDLTIVGHSFHLNNDLQPVGESTIYSYAALEASQQMAITEKSKCSISVRMKCQRELEDPNATGEGGWQVRKVLLWEVKFVPSFMEGLIKREWLDKEYVQFLEQLPLSFSKEEAAIFRAFFEKFGQGFVKVGYYGGEYRFKDDNTTGPFRGGNISLQNADSLKEWEKSLHVNPAKIILNSDEDIEFHYNFVPTLPWLSNRKAKAEAIEEASKHYRLNSGNQSLEDNGAELRKDDTQASKDVVVLPIAPVVKGPVPGNSAPFLGQRVLGRGYNLEGDGEIMDCEIYKREVVNAHMISMTCSKTLDTTLDKCNVNRVFLLERNIRTNSSSSRVIKVLLTKMRFSTVFENDRTRKSSLRESFVANLEALPRRYTELNRRRFSKFFKKYGQGFVKVGYYGGEAVFNASGNSKEEADDYGGLEERFAKAVEIQPPVSPVTFRGGDRSYHHVETLDAWKDSFNASPTNLEELITDVFSDVELYHDFVAELHWLDDHDRKADALEQAFYDLYYKPDGHREGRVTESKSKFNLIKVRKVFDWKL